MLPIPNQMSIGRNQEDFSKDEHEVDTRRNRRESNPWMAKEKEGVGSDGAISY